MTKFVARVPFLPDHPPSACGAHVAPLNAPYLCDRLASNLWRLSAAVPTGEHGDHTLCTAPCGVEVRERTQNFASHLVESDLRGDGVVVGVAAAGFPQGRIQARRRRVCYPVPSPLD